MGPSGSGNTILVAAVGLIRPTGRSPGRYSAAASASLMPSGPPWIYPAVIGTAVVLVLTATLLHLASAPVPSRRSRRTDLTGH